MPRPLATVRRASRSSGAAAGERPGTVRIIGGKWKGRKLPIAAGVRPTPDRVRETVFNWLARELPGTRVLDLFAGTGALGFEALSRGAEHAVLVERNRATARRLAAQRDALGAAAAVEQADALDWLARATERWQVAFLDPPFEGGLLHAALAAVSARLTPTGFVYVEADEDLGALDVAAAGFAVHRAGRAGAVHYGLLRRR